MYAFFVCFIFVFYVIPLTRKHFQGILIHIIVRYTTGKADVFLNPKTKDSLNFL